MCLLMIVSKHFWIPFTLCPMSEQREFQCRRIDEPYPRPKLSPCHANTSTSPLTMEWLHDLTRVPAWEGIHRLFKLLEVQDLQQQVTCIHLLVRWPRRASRTSKISKNPLFSQIFSKYLFLSQEIFKILYKSLKIFKKLRKESVNSEYLKISWNLSKKQKCM